MKSSALIVVVVLLVLAGAGVMYFSASPVMEPVPVACTAEAKLCPDGSSVGRIGPNCEFAQCPAPVSGGISIGGNAVIHGTTIGVLELLEDSRCPVDVQCIQAGTVRVRTSIDSYNRDFTFTLLQPQVVGNVTITLASVIPATKHSGQAVVPSDYRFTFTVVPVATPAPTGSGVRGTVLLGPTCPVMRDPPDPQCADKSYATTILVSRVGSGTVIATGKSSANGTFEISLAPGTYTLAAQGGSVLPRCSPVDAVVGASGYVTANISCDSGIR